MKRIELNGHITWYIPNKLGCRLKTDALLKNETGIEADIPIDQFTPICSVKNKANQCIVFLSGQQLIINESYENIKELITNIQILNNQL